MRLLKLLFSKARSKQDVRHAKGFVVYTSAGCSCSQEAIGQLRDHGVEPCIVDLDTAPEVKHEFGAQTPIVQLDGRVRFFGKVDPLLLARLVENRRRLGE